jgi:hypothetical protein
MKTSYLVWRPSNVIPNAAALDHLTGFDRIGRLWRGESFAGQFPEEATFRMRPDLPQNTVLTDCLSNTDSLIVGSERLKDFLMAQKISDIEYHPVTIRDHKKKVIKGKYFIVNPIHNIDCLDTEASGAEMSQINPEKVQFIKKLVLRNDRLDLSRQLFRITNYNMITLVRDDLATAIGNAGFTGMNFVETSRHPK